MYGHRSSFAQAYPPGGRSPYGGYVQYPGDHRFSELYDYVDEDRNVLSPNSRNNAVFEEDDNEPDRIHIKYRGETWTSDFPPFSIAEEKVLVRHVRELVALRLGYEGHEGRIKLVYKDKELKHNDTPLRKYGCKQNSEIAVILLQEPKNWDRKQQSDSDNASIGSGRRSVEEVRPRRHNSTHRRRDPEPRPNHTERTTYNGRLHPESAHNTPPNANTPPRQPSPARPAQRNARQPSPEPSRVQRPTADPSTMLAKIQTIQYEFYSEWFPKIQEFMRSPPKDSDERGKEYRKLSEIVYKRVFEQGDLIEPEGADKEEIRATRKKLFADVHVILKDLDRFKPKDSK